MIEVENLGFTYRGGAAPVLEGVSFAVGKGEVYGLLGPSGAGKSTTQAILMGLLTGFTGSARLFGAPVGRLGRAVYERIGVSFELPALYLRLTARENLKLFAALYTGPGRAPGEVLEAVDLADAADQKVETFSKGMKMRLGLARALINDPELLFLDEPTAGQDPARARHTRELILRMKDAGKTVFLATHNMAEAEEICDRVGFLAHRHIPGTGAPEARKRADAARERQEVLRVGAGAEKRGFAMDGIGANADFRALLGSGREIVSMHTLEASLDDVFIKATGAAE